MGSGPSSADQAQASQLRRQAQDLRAQATAIRREVEDAQLQSNYDHRNSGYGGPVAGPDMSWINGKKTQAEALESEARALDQQAGQLGGY